MVTMGQTGPCCTVMDVMDDVLGPVTVVIFSLMMDPDWN